MNASRTIARSRRPRWTRHRNSLRRHVLPGGDPFAAQLPRIPTEVYLALDAQRGRTNNFEGSYVLALGKVDRVSCAPLPLNHVVRIERPPTIPFCVPQP